MRNGDWLELNAIEEIAAELCEELGRDPTDEEVLLRFEKKVNASKDKWHDSEDS